MSGPQRRLRTVDDPVAPQEVRRARTGGTKFVWWFLASFFFVLGSAACTTRFGASIPESDGGAPGDAGGDGGGGGECGNGVMEPGESCDGTDLGGATCESVSEGYGGGRLFCNDTCEVETSECIPKGCGDGVLDLGEEYDDGNTDNTDACLATCVAAQCGDGFLWEGVEECDDGNTSDCDGCSAACSLEACGNGVVECAEECDDGNTVDGDACLSSCVEATCGDGVLWEGVEECDGAELGGATCEGLGFIQGDLSCTSDCALDSSECVQCGDCKSCTKTECFRDVYWWEDSACTVPYGNCTPCSNWGPSNSTHSDGSFFCHPNGTYSPYWNGGPCTWVEMDYEYDCDECGEWTCP